ncbi:MAG: cation-transporting P-type ATPase [Patescibacteria group bacterium]|nr:cation-transporting P-type ATPase [Patescibacteria group bacterium]
MALENTGLTTAEAKNRLEKYGPNLLKKHKEVRFLGIAKEEITEPMILLLIFVGVIYSIWGKVEDAITIFIVIMLLVFVEVWNEYRAKKAIAALSKISEPKTRVLREEKITEIDTFEVVIGDVLILAPGTRISADGIILTSYSLQVDESSLTGESFAVEKKTGDEIFAGTLVVAGEGKGEVKKTGADTKMGKITLMAQEIKEPKTPLQLAMKDLVGKLVWFALLFSALIPVIGFLRGQDTKTMVLTGLALAFAIIPEEFPILITMILGLGSYRLSKQNFLVKKIKAAEVLGDATVILTDKTGTITEGKMHVASVFPENKQEEILLAAYLATTEISLTPTDSAIIQKAKELKLDNLGEIISERNFGNDRKTKGVLRENNNKFFLYESGAPEEVLAMCRDGFDEIRKALQRETERGRRVIGVAKKEINASDKNKSVGELEKNLEFVGLISLEDPPRQGVKDTIETARKAGIRTVMVTGDHPLTAAFIAKSVGIEADKVLIGADLDKLSDEELEKVAKEVNVFARTFPEHKYRLVKALRAGGEVVAVTGDGINDALALKGADIGIAMGIKGTDAAKEAADVVLADDNFITISHAIFEGRKFYDNLVKSVRYYLSVKVALVSVLFIPILFGLPLPFSPIQIILLELFMDLAASAGFVGEPIEKTIYNRPPRNPKAKIFDAKLISQIFIGGITLFVAVMASYLYAIAHDASIVHLQTYAFTAWILGHIILAYVSRSETIPLYKLGVFTNKTMNWWLVSVIVFLFLILGVPVINSEFKLASITFMEFVLILLSSFVIIFWLEVKKIILQKNKK